MTLAPAIATIREIQRLDLVRRARETGVFLGKKLSALKEKHPCVGDVRGIGMFWAVELVKNRETKQAFSTMADKVAGKPLLVDRIGAEMMKNGVFLQPWISHFVIAPPLIISEAEIETAVAVLDHALELADAEVKGSHS